MNASTLRSALPWLVSAMAVCASLVPDALGPQDPAEPVLKAAEETDAFRVHYLEIVTPDPEATCALLEKVHGVSFGEPVAELGGARTAPLAVGGTLAVRAPMHADEEPVVRPYLLVDDIEAAVEEAKELKGEIAVPPTGTVEDGTFAIYFHGGTQFGLWKL